MAGSVSLEGLVRLGRGREADVFAWDGGRALRLAHDPAQALSIDQEALALEAASRAGAPVPAVYERIEVEGRPGLILERVDGVDMISLLGRRPWLVLSVARATGTAHAEVHSLEAPEALPSVRERLRGRLESELVPGELGERALLELAALPDGDRLCHGDLHPANLLRTAERDVVIDWTGAARGDPAADVARTLIVLNVGAVHEDAPALVKALERVGRRLLVGGYLRSYRRRSELDPALVRRWLPVVGAARLAEGIEEERADLVSLLRGPGALV